MKYVGEHGIHTKNFRLAWFPTWRTHSGYKSDFIVFDTPRRGCWLLWIGALAIEIGHRP